MKVTGSQIIIKMLELYGIKTVAGIPGGSILPLYNELCKSSIKHILVRQEQSAGFIAQGIARTTGLPAICMATSGPGAMNLLTSIADARCDSIPIIAITGQVNSYLIGTDAFQEADTFGLSFPITKHSIAIKKAEELLTAIPEAFKIAMNGRPGPVLIDIPRDIQMAEIEIDSFPNKDVFNSNEQIRFESNAEEISEKINKSFELIKESQKPVLYVGGGANSPISSKVLREFKKLVRMPVVSSLMGIGCISKDDCDYVGMVGMHGSYAANYAMYESDLVIAAGVRFDDRATGIVTKFCPNAKIIHIDIDAAEINKILTSQVSFVSKVETVIPLLNKKIMDNKKELTNSEENKNNWANKILDISKNSFSELCGSPNKDGQNSYNEFINPRTFIKNVPSLAKEVGLNEDKIIVTTDVGQHQMFTAQYYPVKEPRTFLTSGSLGTMGFGLPTAIGAAIANPDKRIICFSGDGSIMMNIQELITLAENNLPVTVIIFINGTLGMVYQQQKYLFEKNYSASTFKKNADYLKIAEGFGIEGTNANTDKDWYKKAFDKNRKNKPFLVTVNVNHEEDVLPFVPGGKCNIDSIR